MEFVTLQVPRLLQILELTMNGAHVHAVFRGIICRYCAKPIRLTSPFIKREMSIKHDDSRVQELSSKVFAKRCRNCLKEAIYNLDQIADFPVQVNHTEKAM
jgi:hypothetical protein